MDTDNIKNNDKENAKEESTLSTSTAPFVQELSEPSEDMIFLDKSKPDRKKSSGDDVMLTQCILCLMLALSVFLLKFISDDFQGELLSIYNEKTSAPAAPFIVKIMETIEAWFKG